MENPNVVNFKTNCVDFQDVVTRMQARDSEMREAFTSADVIFTQDLRTGERALLYGMEILEDIQNGRASEFTEPKSLLCVNIDNSVEAQQLEYMVATVTVLRGSCCYSDRL